MAGAGCAVIGWNEHVRPARGKEALVVATYNVRTLPMKGRNGYGRDECVLTKVQQLDCYFVGLQETRTQGETAFYAAVYGVFYCVQQ